MKNSLKIFILFMSIFLIFSCKKENIIDIKSNVSSEGNARLLQNKQGKEKYNINLKKTVDKFYH